MQALKKQTSKKLLERVSKALDDNVPLEVLVPLLESAAKLLEVSKTIDTLEMKDIPSVLPISENHARTWSKHPNAPVVRIGERVLWPVHLLYAWLSVPQNFADLSKYKTA